MSYDKLFKLQRAPHLISILIHDSDFLKFNHYPMTSLNTKNDLNLPTYTDIEHYKLFRQAGQKLCDELAKKFLSKSVLKECGKKLGIFKNNMMVFDSEDAMSVLFDYCLHQFYVNKLSIAERYLRISPPDSNSIEYEILQSMLKAHYSIYIAKEVFEKLYEGRTDITIIRHNPVQARFYIIVSKPTKILEHKQSLEQQMYGVKPFFSILRAMSE